MKKGVKDATKRSNDNQKTAKKIDYTTRIVTGTEIPNLLKNRPFKIRFK